eukprot:1145291-Pelagomonas_calceolata.AAC.3
MLCHMPVKVSRGVKDSILFRIACRSTATMTMMRRPLMQQGQQQVCEQERCEHNQAEATARICMPGELCAQ